MTMMPRHPDTISGLAPDCRRVLRTAYMQIQSAMDPPLEPLRYIEESDDQGTPRVREETADERSARLGAEHRAGVASAIARYREIAEMWGVKS